MATPTAGSQTTSLVRLITRLRPELHDLVAPHSPLFMDGVVQTGARDASEVALNPQPLPPRDILRFAVHQTVKGVAEAAIAAHQIGRGAGEILHEVGEDWCPTPPHSKFPWPKRWPTPWPPGEPYPIDPEFATPAVQATAGLAFQAYADSVADEKLSAAFGELADQLCEAALQST